MADDVYLGMRPGDLDGKPYAGFWQPDMSPIQAQANQALLRGEAARELAFGLDDVSELLKPGYLPLENGYARLADGQTFVAVRTEMPGVTGPMFEWWMGWHYMEAQRYKLWHPGAHLNNGTREMRGDDPMLTDRQKYMTTHYVTEYVGKNPEKITITFFEPDRIFGDKANLPSGSTTALVCGRVDLLRAPITIGWLIHQIRELDDGTEMRSRFWLGRPEISGGRGGDVWNWLLRSRWLQRFIMPRNLGQDMLTHCALEMNHLAGFLPELYGLYHPDADGPT